MRPAWARLFRHDWLLCLVLFGALAALRAYGLFGPVDVRMLVLAGFFAMWFLPLIFLTREGRRTIGLKRPERPIWLVWGAGLGLGASALVFGLGYALFGHGPDDWSVSLLNSWAIDDSMRQIGRLSLFVMFTLPAVIFSPVGEELFFRGMIHESARPRLGQAGAALVNALAFSGVHLLHHGLTWTDGGLEFAAASGLLWGALIFGVALLFTECRRRSGSIWGAVAAHASFNLATNVLIFWLLF